jgi:integrase/recombinase XerD
VQIGSAYWLRIPIGKLHTDRYIPLHPQLKTMLDEWITDHRPAGPRSKRLLVEKGRPISHQRVASALSRISHQAGIGHVTPHQLRHTLATWCEECWYKRDPADREPDAGLWDRPVDW